MHESAGRVSLSGACAGAAVAEQGPQGSRKTDEPNDKTGAEMMNKKMRAGRGNNRKWIYGGGAAVLATALFVGLGAIVAEGAEGPGVDGDFAHATAMADAPLVTLYKNPTCACCGDWAEHMRANGFRVDVKEGADLARVKEELGVPFSAASCHTAEVDGYALEGHVPADAVKRLLENRPEIAGIAVPGMPLGVPGMPGEGFGSYEILALQKDGATRVYASK